MYKRMLVLMLVLVYLCGCQSSDPYVRRSEFLTESKRIAEARTNLAITKLDRTVDTAIEELRTTIAQSAESISSLESRFETFAAQNAESISELKSGLELIARRNGNSIEQNAQSISSLESRFDTLAARNAESISELKSTLELSNRRNSDSIKQNIESISSLDSTLSDLVKQNARSIEDLSTDLEQLENELSQVRLDVRQELSKQQADQTETTGQLAERVEQLRSGFQRAFILSAEYPHSKGPLSPRDRLFEGAPTEGKESNPPRYNSPVLTEKGAPASLQRSSLQLSFAVVGLAVVLSGPIVAELYARRQRKLVESPTRRLAERAWRDR